MDIQIKNNSFESKIILSYDILSNKILDYYRENNYIASIFIKDFKLNFFWEICKIKKPIMLFLNENIKSNNLTKRLENDENIFIFPQTNQIYINNNKNIKFTHNFTWEDFIKFNDFLKRKNTNVIIYQGKEENLKIFNKFNVPILGTLTSENVIKYPNIINIKNLISFLNSKNTKVFYIGKEIDFKGNNYEYIYLNKNKVSQDFLEISKKELSTLLNNTRKTFLQNLRKNRKKNFNNTNIPNVNLPSSDVQLEDKLQILDHPSKTKRILMKNYKKYMEKINNIEYPIKSAIFKINFIIKDNPIIDLNNSNESILLEYQLMFHLIKTHMIYYNSVLLNDKIDKNNFINVNKFLTEYNNLKKNNYLYENTIVKCPKDKFDLIFYLGDTQKDLEIYDYLPYPKILSGIISPDIWKDDRHIISFPSKKYLDIINSGFLKDENNEIISLPERFVIKRNFIGPKLEKSRNLKSELFADYIIFVETTNYKAVEISLLENILDKIRVEYDKEIYLLISSSTNSKKSKYTRYISNYHFLVTNFDLVIVLEDIWENKYSLTYTILQSLYNQVPLLLSKNPILVEDFNNYSGLFEGLNKNIIGINEVKNFFEDKIRNLLSDELKETKFLEIKKEIWNSKVSKHYSDYFTEIINFLKKKNYQRNNISYNSNDKEGFNFYYHENLTPINLPMIYQNVENFLDLIKPFKNILLISSDYPGYGGAASQNNEIASFLRLHGHECKELYYLFDTIPIKEANKIINKFRKPVDKFDFESLLKDEEKDEFFYNNVRITKIENLEEDLEQMEQEFKPDLIILKNHLNGKKIPKKFNNIYYLLAGIYQNSLNKFYYNLNVRESEKFLNKAIIDVIRDNRVKTITNSVHTKKILEDNFDVKSEIYYTNFICQYPKKLPNFNKKDFSKRQFDYGIICSDFNRKIKNLQNICEDLSSEVNDDEKIIFIGKNSKKYLKLFKNQKNITCVDLIPNYLVTDYLKKIKNILINSYYESNSNLAIQAKFNGCNVIRKIISKDNNKIKILITSTQKPGNGGSATNAYKLTKWLRKLNYQVAIVFFNKEEAEKINPDKIEGLFSIRDNVKTKSFYNQNEKITLRNKIIEYLSGYPDIIYSFNYYTPILSRKLFPNSYLYYFIVGNPVLTIGEDSMINREVSIQKFLKEDFNLGDFDKKSYDLEYETLQICDEVVIDQGNLNIKTISKVHPEFRYLYNNYYNYGINILLPELKPLDSTKEFELVIISSNWKRLVKNPKLAYMIFREFPEYRKLVIGNNSNIFDKIPNTTCLPLLEYNKTMEYISRSKLLLITSFSETGPNTIIEAFSNKCQVLSSKNIGYQRYLKDYHLCEDVYDLDDWKNKVKYIINNFKFLPIPKIEVEEDKERFLELINHKKVDYKPNVLIVCGDKPYYGGAATNSYNLIKLLLEKKIDVSGLFISYQKEGLDDPDNLGCVEHIFLDKDIERQLIKWKKSHNNFDIIFCKNYKVFTLIKKTLPDIPIIYSPSGLRQVTAKISKLKKFYKEMVDEKIELIDSTHDLVKEENWYEFIMKNDKYLENYSLETADYLLPNSQITFDIIKQYYDEKVTCKLLEPIYLTNIQFIEKANFNFRKRKYDFAFIATNWKRATKNIWWVKSIIKKFKGSNYNILVVGSNHNITEKDFPKEAYPNLEVRNHVLRQEMIKIFQDIKSVVITSYYESNPNVMIEAIYCGCNVVTSDNVGNSENLRKQLLVKSPYKVNNWASSIEISTKKLFPYLGPSLETAREQYLSLIKNLSCKQEAVGIYKVNAKWDLEAKVNRKEYIEYNWINSSKLEDFEEHVGRKTDIFSNIYLHLFKEFVNKMGFKYSHYLFIDETLEVSYRTKWENINIWILKSKEEVMYFNQAKFYFVRGNYPNFYQKLIPINSYSIYYPATSFKYNYNIKNNEKIIKRDLMNYFNKRNHPQYERYNMVLHHEDENYAKQFDKCKRIMFKKFSLGNTFKFKNMERIYDIIYVAQAVQKSKNHQLFFDFIKYCDNNNIKIRIAYVSNKEVLEKNYNNFYVPKNSSVQLKYFSHLSPEDLSDLYNQSSINLVLSHRDCVPRVIVESIECGCYNVATDLLSDGKYYYDGICGELLSFDYGEVEIISSGMISYVSNPIIFKKLINLVNQEYNHEKISQEGCKLYNIDVTVNTIMKELL